MSEATPGRIRPSFGTDAGAARRANQAVAGFVAELQAGWDQHDAGITNGTSPMTSCGAARVTR